MDTVHQRPLVVDMDGTLIRTDMLLESLLRAIRNRPWCLLLLPFWLLQGRAVLKARLAGCGQPDMTVIPLSRPVVDFLQQQKQAGRRLVLATASSRPLAEGLAARTGLFDEVLASDAATNLKAARKAAVLVARYGPQGFDYIGNDRADLPVWKVAHTAHVATGNAAFARRARAQGAQAGEWFRTGGMSWRTWAQALRLHQWVKNCLVLVPLVMSHEVGNPAMLGLAVLAFLAFSLCASSVYLLNDMLDLDDDRHHRSKCRRPMACGDMPLVAGLLLFPFLLLAGLGLAACFVSMPFALVIALYYLLTLAYSFWLKRLLFVDVVMLAGLYTIRIVGGAVATGLDVSFWLVAFSVFVFLSLAIVKRYTELLPLRDMPEAGVLKGRGYCVDDLPILLSLGTASGYLSVLVMALYINSENVTNLYAHAEGLWLLCPVMLYWISRIWLMTHRGRMHDDPIVFAIKDPVSRYTALCMGLILLLAS